jgi:hypothetical protein
VLLALVVDLVNPVPRLIVFAVAVTVAVVAVKAGSQPIDSIQEVLADQGERHARYQAGWEGGTSKVLPMLRTLSPDTDGDTARKGGGER